MSKKVKSIYEKKFLNKHTNWSILLLIIWGFFFTEVVGIFCIDTPIGYLTKQSVQGFSGIITASLCLMIHKRWFFPEFSGCMSCGKTKTALILSPLYFIYLLPIFVISIATSGIEVLFTINKTSIQIIQVTGMSIMAGFAEETIFRGLPGSYLMRQWKNDQKRIFKTVVITSILFGLAHATNLFKGATVGYTIFQVIGAAAIGIFFCALFIRSGLLWPGIFLHVLNDVIAFIYSPVNEWSKPTELMAQKFELINIIDLALCLSLAAIGFYLIRPAKKQEIDELWAKKWKPFNPETTGYSFRLEEPADYRRVENMTREAFWNVYRPGCTEHYVIHCCREKEAFIKELSIVMEVYGKVIGHAMFTHSKIETENVDAIPVITLGPICIDPQFERKGYGILLLNHVIEQAKKLGYGAIMLEGNPDFYGKAGFESATAKGIRYADDLESDAPYFMCRILKEGYFDGVKGIYHDPEEYFAAMQNEEDFEKYDLGFPVKKKK